MRGPHALVAAAAVLSIFVGVAWAKDDRARIGDLADDNKFQVIYGDTLVAGQMLGKAQTAKPPQIAAPDASAFHLYTVIMYDPDAPSPDSPICKDWVHWIYTDANGKHLTGGRQLLPYNGPTPPEGVHNYHLALYSQRAELTDAKAPTSRCKFSPSQFAQDNSLTLVGLQSFKVSAGSD